MRALAIGGGLLGLVLVVGIMGYVMVGMKAPAPADGSSGRPGGGAASPGYVGGMVDARDSAAANIALATVRQRLQAHRAMNGQYPASLDDLTKDAPLPKLPRDLKCKYDPATGSVEAE